MADSVGIFAGMFAGMDRARSALDYHLTRHNILTSNVAHVDTPGYVPRDLARAESPSFARVLELAMTSSSHLPGQEMTSPTARTFEDRSAGAGNDGNYVSIDREAAKLAANQLRYEVIAQFASGRSLLYAANDGKG